MMSRWQETFSPAFNNVNDPRSHCRYAVHLHSPYDLPCFSKPHELIEYLGYHSSSSANRLPVSHLKRDLSFLLSLPPSCLDSLSHSQSHTHEAVHSALIQHMILKWANASRYMHVMGIEMIGRASRTQIHDRILFFI